MTLGLGASHRDVGAPAEHDHVLRRDGCRTKRRALDSVGQRKSGGEREGGIMGRLDGKVAVVTGSGSGIGAASALLLAREGARVVVADIDEDSAQRTVASI